MKSRAALPGCALLLALQWGAFGCARKGEPKPGAEPGAARPSTRPPAPGMPAPVGAERGTDAGKDAQPARAAADAGASGSPPPPSASPASPTQRQPPAAAAAQAPTRALADWPYWSEPELVGPLVGPGSPVARSPLSLYGTDLGWSFEHQGQLYMLFGDTMPTSHYYCDVPLPIDDDSIARLSDQLTSGVPELQFATLADAANQFSPIQLFAGSQSVGLGLGQTPMSGWSDGEHAFAAFNRDDYLRCTQGPGLVRSCDASAGFRCSSRIGECQPALGASATPCDRATQAECMPGQSCAASSTGFCFDPGSSQYDGTTGGELAALARNIPLALQRADRPELYDSVFTLATSKFRNLTTRTVERLSGSSTGNDYGQGHGALLVWGRPGFTAEAGHQAQLYLMTHPLPLELQSDPQGLRFEPQYFAGVDPRSGEPRWSHDQRDARPLAQDGTPDGDPHEPLVMVNQMAVSWLAAPIERWVMIYGGDLPDPLLNDPAAARAGAAPGAIMLRYAEHPWGPWTRPEPLLAPGSPARIGDPYGPGGFLFHYDCKDQPGASCAQTDPLRPLEAWLDCQPPNVQTDIGHLYGSNIIDAYTQQNGDDGLDVFWNVSTWNPYGVVLMKTTFRR